MAQVIVAVRYLTLSKRSRSHIQGMADAIVDGFQRWLDELSRLFFDDEQDQSDIRRVYVQCIQALYRRVALMEERKESQSRACKLSKMRNKFPKNTLKHKESRGKKRLQCRVPYIIRHGEPGEMPVDFVTNIFQKASPPGCKMYHDQFSGRWMVKLGTYSKSRSWIKYGHTESGVLILAKAWERYMELYGLPNCPIKGLMELAKAIESNCPTSSLAESPLGKAISAYAVSEAAASSVSSEASSASASDAAVSVA